MSRTGVGIRVVIDGKQIDDGCFPWGGEVWQEKRRNLLYNSARTGTGGINAAGPLTVVMSGSFDGGAFVRVTHTTPKTVAVNADFVQIANAAWGGQSIAAAAPVNPSTVYTMSIYVRCSVAITVRLSPQSINGGGGGTSATISAGGLNTPLAANVWTRLFVTFKTPASGMGAVRLDIDAGAGFTIPAGGVFDLSAALLEASGTLGAPFDGASSVSGDPSLERYRWLDTPPYSRSVFETRTWAAPADPMPEGLSADEGLNIVWGRATTVEQPSPSTCTFRVTDAAGSLYYQNFRIGSDVRVYADATISGGATLPAFADPDFESEVRAVTKNSVVGRDNRHVETGAMSAVMKPINTGMVYSAQFPPSTLQTPGSNPNAWDNLPHLSPGETWRLSVRVWVPTGLTVTVRPVIYSGPYATSATTLAPIGTASTPGWNTVAADVSPGVQLGWMGVQLDASGGLDWATTPDDWTWATIDQNLEWRDLSDVYLDRVQILAPEAGTNVTILVFGGRITDMGSAWDGSSPALDVTATDFLGDLGNRFVGDEPWLLEPLATRVNRVLTLARAGSEPAITADIATTYAPVLLSWEDVDHRAASGLLADIANSVDGVLWSATHIVTGPYVKIEDPGQRPALYQLALEGGVIVIEVIDPETLPVDQRPLDLSACDVLRDPVEFVLDVADIATRATVGWKEQTVDEEGLPSPTDRTAAVIDADRENQFGTRNISTQTLLTTQPAAVTVADRLLARQTGQWRMSGLRIADEDFNVPDATAVVILTTLLDGVRRGGLPVRVVDLPAWSPIGTDAPAYLEGGQYTYSGGGWVLSLTISRGTGLGRNAAWDEIPPTWQWDQWSPNITWDDLRGVAAKAVSNTLPEEQ